MRQLLRIVLRVSGAITLAALAFVAFCAVRGIPRYNVRPPKLEVEVTPERVARGEKLASLLCAECHKDPRTGKLTGRRMRDLPSMFGVIYSKNITQEPVYGVGAWTDGELALLLRSGISRDGTYVPPWMPKLVHFSDEDLMSVIAFLRSDHPLVQASAVEPEGKTEPSLLVKVLANVSFGPLPYPEKPIATPSVSDKVAYGKYLAQGLDCWTCHSPDLMKLDIANPERTPGYLSGGGVMHDDHGNEVYTANLTFDEETGIGRWSERQFIDTVRTGVRADGRALRSPMVARPQLNDAELSAIYAYLKSLPKIRRQVPRNAPLVPKNAEPGKRGYYAYACNSCHGDSGRGLADLTTANAHYPDDAELISWIKNAPSVKPGVAMPKWDGIIKEEDYAPLAGYVRKLAKGDAKGALSSL